MEPVFCIMGNYDYSKLLDRAEGTFSKSDKRESRLKIPEPETMGEGKITIVRNFGEIVDLVNRDPRHIAKFLMKELGIGVTQDGNRLTINRKVSPQAISEKIRQYMDTFVVCYECKSPDTEIRRIGRTDVMFCKACGAQNPIRGAGTGRTEENKVEEGRTYNVTVSDVGQSGEGKASLYGVTIIIPGGKRGDEVRVYIKKIRKGVAVGEVIKEKK